MAQSRPARFTGKHMAAILVAGFGVVALVNFTMASFAISGFSGVLVDNTYVASQKFNGWLEEAKADEALGWSATASRDEAGFVELETAGIPQGASVTAELRRPIGERQYADLAFHPAGEGVYRSTTMVETGRWTMRLNVEASGQSWAQESELP